MTATLRCTQGEDICFSERRDGEKERNDIGRGVGNSLCTMLRVRLLQAQLVLMLCSLIIKRE